MASSIIDAGCPNIDEVKMNRMDAYRGWSPMMSINRIKALYDMPIFHISFGWIQLAAALEFIQGPRKSVTQPMSVGRWKWEGRQLIRKCIFDKRFVEVRTADAFSSVSLAQDDVRCHWPELIYAYFWPLGRWFCCLLIWWHLFCTDEHFYWILFFHAIGCRAALGAKKYIGFFQGWLPAHSLTCSAGLLVSIAESF